MTYFSWYNSLIMKYELQQLQKLLNILAFTLVVILKTRLDRIYKLLFLMYLFT